MRQATQLPDGSGVMKKLLSPYRFTFLTSKPTRSLQSVSVVRHRHLVPRYPKPGALTSKSGGTWEFVRNENSQAPSQTR